jgi:CheY-like chemotaxis protein
MVVEDHEGTRAILAIALEAEGYEVVLAEDGLDALDKLSDPAPALIVLDLALPRMDGVTLAAELKRCGLRPAIPILVLTADTKGARKAGSIGAEAFLEKPFDLDTLVQEVARLTAGSDAPAVTALGMAAIIESSSGHHPSLIRRL